MLLQPRRSLPRRRAATPAEPGIPPAVGAPFGVEKPTGPPRVFYQ